MWFDRAPPGGEWLRGLLEERFAGGFSWRCSETRLPVLPRLRGGGPWAPTAMVSRPFSEGDSAFWKSEGDGTGCARSPVRGVWTRAKELSG